MQCKRTTVLFSFNKTPTFLEHNSQSIKAIDLKLWTPRQHIKTTLSSFYGIT